MSNSRPLDSPPYTIDTERPLAIKIVCIIGFLFSIYQFIMLFIVSYAMDFQYETAGTIYLKIMPVINIICFAGFWAMRKAAVILYALNLIAAICVIASFLNFYILGSIVILVAVLGQVHRMRKFI